MTRVRANRRRTDFDSLWLITFADLMVQLMAFFAVAYAFNMQDQSKANEMLESLKRALGMAQAVGATGGGEGILEGHGGLAPERAADLEKLLSDMKATEGPDEGRRLRIVSFRGALLYEEGSTTLNPTFQPLLKRIAELVKEYPGFQLVCEGHAAPGERGRGGADSLELSGQRAQAAFRFLVSQGVDPQAVAAEALGDARPEGEVSSPEGRALQRRVRFRFQRVAER